MIDFFLKKIYEEKALFSQAPIFIFLVFCIALFLGIFLSSLYYKERINILNEKLELYEVKLDFSSPDEAISIMIEVRENLQQTLSKTRAELQNTRYSDQEDMLSNFKPICASKEDSTETLRQILIYNLIGKELQIPEFVNSNYCEQKY